MTAPKLKTRDGSDLYDRDFHAWTQDQAARLRTLSGQQRIDAAHLAEEIEDLGNRDIRELNSRLREALTHLLKLAAYPAQEPPRHWFEEVDRQHTDALEVVAQSPGLRQHVDVQDIWVKALRRANRALAKYDEPPLPTDPHCPFSRDELLDNDFDPDAALIRVKGALADAREGR